MVNFDKFIFFFKKKSQLNLSVKMTPLTTHLKNGM